MPVRRFRWIKIQSAIVDHPKFRALDPSLQAALFKLMCFAGSMHPRGFLPQAFIKQIAGALGDSYMINPSRVIERVINPLVSARWLETASLGWKIHDWDYWQNQPAVEDFQPADQPADQPAVDNNGAIIGDKSCLSSARYVESKNKDTSYPPRGLFDDDCKLSACDAFDKEISAIPVKARKVRKPPVSDDRDLPLKEFQERFWGEHRAGTLTSACIKADWIRRAAMLARTRGDSAYSLQSLCDSWSEFVLSTNAYERRQSMRYWADNVQVFVERHKLRVKSGGNGHGEVNEQSFAKRVAWLRTCVEYGQVLTEEERGILASADRQSIDEGL